ncbi:2-oxoacid:ferredoxin oxidoreductase subunit beta [Selenomonadales bacterium OttesenSCG-928-I06]|nr:2-oxoacid:ferredoxin oxidoreductase subunit beta [Selenomonadales bacterium OttesenSCG-928-I06]
MASTEKYLRKTALPHIWCPGCGNGVVLSAIVRAIDKMGLDQNKTVVVSGIGCSSRASTYLDFNTIHTAHGRALTFATGIKLANPELNVIVITGDGDATAIGGNHFIHAARRNIDLTTVIFNNSIYGMTGGQSSPATPINSLSTTAPYGQFERPFDIPALAIASGATYVARGTAFHTEMLTNLIAKGIENKGFSVIDAITQCPIAYGRRNKLRTASAMLKWQQDNSVRIEDSKKMSPKDLEGKMIIGELYKSEAPEYTALYDDLIKRVQGGSK